MTSRTLDGAEGAAHVLSRTGAIATGRSVVAQAGDEGVPNADYPLYWLQMVYPWFETPIICSVSFGRPRCRGTGTPC